MNPELITVLLAATQMGTDSHVAVSVGYRIALNHVLDKYDAENAFELPEPLASFVADMNENAIQAFDLLSATA